MATWMIVESFGNDRFENKLNPVGWAFYSASTLICIPERSHHVTPIH
ncbi:hypothetical protein [Polaromonas glacialis]|nr:hypothetical protein [Polaromonas glacialis]